MTPSFRGRMAWMWLGVRPIIRLASIPTARGRPSLTLTATTDGSFKMMPRPRTKTRVFAVPRSTAMSRPNRKNRLSPICCEPPRGERRGSSPEISELFCRGRNPPYLVDRYSSTLGSHPVSGRCSGSRHSGDVGRAPLAGQGIGETCARRAPAPTGRTALCGFWRLCHGGPMWIDQRGSEVLGAPECHRLLALAAKEVGYGRLAVSREGAPVVVPVNFAWHEHQVLVRL